MRFGETVSVFLISSCLCSIGSGEPSGSAKILGSGSCSTSGCHGGAGPNRGAYNIWKDYDPHVNAAATLENGRSRAMAREMKIEVKPSEAKSCTVCHSPTRHVSASLLAKPPQGHGIDSGVSCVSCHGPAKDWLLSHTRPEYPRDALERLGMRQLDSPYQRANNCVACHQNLSDELVAAKHPPLIFELDGLLVAQPKHWREDGNFSHAQTWLVGQAVALREAAAQDLREPGERRKAEIEAIRALLKATGTNWDSSRTDLVRYADDYAKRISSTDIGPEETRAMLSRLIYNREPFELRAFDSVTNEYRPWAVGHYAERVALAIDRLNESLAAEGKGKIINGKLLDDLFDAAKPPKSFDAETAGSFVQKLDRLAVSRLKTE